MHLNSTSKILFIICLSVVLVNKKSSAQFNTLWIPDTLSGTQFKLVEKDTMSQILPGQQTLTEGINGKMWGPTLFFNKGDTVHMHVYNNLNDSFIFLSYTFSKLLITLFFYQNKMRNTTN